MFYKVYPYLSIDIETRNLTEEQIEFEAQFLKASANTKDPVKIEKQIADKKEKLKTHGALTDSCNIASIGIHVPGEVPIVIHTFDYEEDLSEEFHVEHLPCKDEKEMMHTFYELVSSACDEETVLVVANRDFDFPRLRLKCIQNRVPIPGPLVPGAGNQTYDVTFMATRYFMKGKKFSVSLDELCQRLGVATGEKAISGAEVPGMVDRGEFKEVIIYNGLDAVKNSECYEMMTGRY